MVLWISGVSEGETVVIGIGVLVTEGIVISVVRIIVLVAFVVGDSEIVCLLEAIVQLTKTNKHKKQDKYRGICLICIIK